MSQTTTKWTFREAADSDWPSVAALLTQAELPLDGAAQHLGYFILAEQQGRVIASAAFEPYGKVVLLRSVTVATELRGQGLGRAIVTEVLNKLQGQGYKQVILLTTTASDFFAAFGFVLIRREDVPEVVLASVEFQSACPASAQVMRLVLT